MRRLVLYLVVLGVSLFIVKAVAPLVVLGVIGLVLLAWLRPESLRRFTDRPQLAQLPAWLRATPMRFAGSVAFAAFVLIGVTLPLGAAGGSADSPPTPRSVAAATAPAEPADEPAPDPAETPTPRPTRAPSATPEPTTVLGEAPTGAVETGTVVNVVDGDTIDVLVEGVEVRVRYIGMDAPEVRSGVEWLGPEATAANAALVEGKEVVLEKDVSETDQYGRALRHVWVADGDGWLLVNRELIRQGFASVTTIPPDVKYVDELYLPAQDEAQAAAMGVWGTPPTPAPTPIPAPIVASAPPAAPPPADSNCEPSYPDICVPIGVPDLSCADMYAQGTSMIRVRYDVAYPDPHDFDDNDDGWGCEG